MLESHKFGYLDANQAPFCRASLSCVKRHTFSMICCVTGTHQIIQLHCQAFGSLGGVIAWYRTAMMIQHVMQELSDLVVFAYVDDCFRVVPQWPPQARELSSSVSRWVWSVTSLNGSLMRGRPNLGYKTSCKPWKKITSLQQWLPSSAGDWPSSTPTSSTDWEGDFSEAHTPSGSDAFIWAASNRICLSLVSFFFRLCFSSPSGHR